MLDTSLVADLRELFERIRPGIGDDGSEPVGSRPVRQVGLGPGAFYLDDAAHRKHKSIVQRLSKSAMVHGGASDEAADRLVTKACHLALDESPDAAVEWLASALAAGMRRWVIGEQTLAAFDAAQIQIGRCMLHQTDAVAATIGAAPGFHEAAERLLGGRVITTEVEAFDAESARWRASDAFEEANSIMLLLSSRVRYGLPGEYFAVGDDGSWSTHHSYAAHSPLLALSRIDGDGRLPPGYRELSAAARKTHDDRTEWESRTLGAARWYLQALVTRFPSASLVAGMTALEALLLKPNTARKAEGLADQMSKFGAKVAGVPDHEVAGWLKGLYQIGRNPATHEASFYRDEREVARLLDLVHSVVQWAVWHLSDMHRIPNAVCKTMDEAHQLPHDDDWPDPRSPH